MTLSIHLQRFTGADLEAHLPEVARLRITVFREWPYLYEGEEAYERNYLRTYVENPGSVVVLAFDGDKVVGASTATPLIGEPENVIHPFRSNGYDPAEVFYLGESVLLPEYRGRRIGVRFFEEREAHAIGLGGFRWFAFCGVQRAADDPRRPVEYVPLDRFWEKRGYRRHPELKTEFTWREIGEEEQSPKPMMFWLKELA